MKRRKNVVYDVTNVEQHKLFGFDASRPLPDVIPKRADSLVLRRRAQKACSEGVLSRFFQPTAAARAIRHVCQAHLVVQVAKGQRIPCKSPGEQELGVVQEARSWRSIPVRADLLRRPAVQPCRSLRGSEAEPTTNSRYSSFRGHERSLDPRRLRRAFRHSRTNSASPKGLRRPSAFGSELRRGKVRLAFRLHTESPVKTRPRYASLSASQWLSRSGIPRPLLRVRWIQTCLQTIGLAPPQSNLERDRCSANRCALGRGSTANR